MKETTLTNRSQLKKFALQCAKQRWVDGRMTRVSDEFLRGVEADLKSLVRKKIESHPTVGKTIK